MSIMAIENAERIVTAHGFTSERLWDGIRVCIPWSHPNVVGVRLEWIECRTYRQVFIALGY